MFHIYKDVIFRLKTQNNMHKSEYFYIFFRKNSKRVDTLQSKNNTHQNKILIDCII